MIFVYENKDNGRQSKWVDGLKRKVKDRLERGESEEPCNSCAVS